MRLKVLWLSEHYLPSLCFCAVSTKQFNRKREKNVLETRLEELGMI